MFGFKLTSARKSPPVFEEGYTFLQKQKITYTVQRKARRRRIAMFVEPSGRLRFLAPLRTRTLTIDNFLHRSQDWVLNKLSDLQNYPSPHFPPQLTEGATLFFLGASYRLTIIHESDRRQACRLLDGKFEINLPDTETSATETQEETRLEIMLWYKKQARHYLKERAAFWADKMQVKIRSLKITSPTRQWGCCTSRNDVRLNWRVMMAAPDVIDYLIVHELAHILHKNHSPRFWDCVAQYLPDYNKQRQILMRMDAGFSL